jgi:hypothetical protein
MAFDVLKRNAPADGNKVGPSYQLAEKVYFGNGQPADITILFGHALTLIGNTTCLGKTINPKVILSAVPTPNASAVAIGQGILRFNLGLTIAFLSLPSIMKFLRSLLSSGESINIETIANIPIRQDYISDLDALFKAWGKSMDSGWQSVIFSERINRDLDWNLFCILDTLVVYHELGHLAKMYEAPVSYQQSYIEIKNHFNSWAVNNTKSIERVLRNKTTAVLSNTKIMDNWFEEALADQIGYRSTYDSSAPASIAADVNCGMALLFNLMELFEIFLETKQVRQTIDTHPPVSLRRDIFTYIRAAQSGMKEIDYLTEMWGAGWVTTTLLRSIFRQFIRYRLGY